jgi:hypothetical protein
LALSEVAKRIIRDGSIRTKVHRTGMYQFMVFKVRYVDVGMDKFVELFVDRVIDLPEVERVANETGLPVEVPNGRVFPKGTGSKDFVVPEPLPIS